MPGFDELFDAVLANRNAESAIAQITALGGRAIPELVRMIRAGRGVYVASALLAFVDVPDRVAALEPLVSHPEVAVRYAGLRALARTGDPRALAVIVHAGERGVLRAITALGDLGDPGGREPLRRLLEQRVGPLERPRLDDGPDLFVLIEGAASLAKLGDFTLRGTMCALAELAGDALDFDDIAGLRRAAVQALDLHVGPGIASVLERACADSDDDIAAAAVTALLHLGRVRAVDIWVARTKLDSAVEAAIEELVGERPRGDPRAWWQAKRSAFDPAICYRRGQPASPGTLLPAVGTSMRGELRYTAGLALISPELPAPPAAETEAIARWWNARRSTITPGNLHRWGRSYAPDACDP